MTAVTGGLVMIITILTGSCRCFWRSMLCVLICAVGISPPLIGHLPGMCHFQLLGANHAGPGHAVGKEVEQQDKNEPVAFHARNLIIEKYS
ncbi:MAG TPA: hypothetical protein PLN94_17900, partial [Thiolinea sp.]|nr:hypothetical protein [Thiolinea sp.]